MRLTAAVVADDAKWERAREWAIADLGFRKVPIFLVDIVASDDTSFELGPLHCFQKPQNAPTVLAASRRPTRLNLKAPPIEPLLPETPVAHLHWRIRRPAAVGTEKPACPIEECSEIAQEREISTLSHCSREERISLLHEMRQNKEW